MRLWGKSGLLLHGRVWVVARNPSLVELLERGTRTHLGAEASVVDGLVTSNEGIQEEQQELRSVSSAGVV